jgi:predicted RNA methylase
MTMINFTELRSHFTISDCGTRCKFNAQLERDVYSKIADALSRLEGKWSKKDDAFVFQYDAKEQIEEIFTTGNLPKRNPLQLHPTPRAQVLDMIESSDNARIHLANAGNRKVRMLEPSIGRCGIADAVKELYPDVEIVGVELDAVNVKLARKKGYDVTHADFLTYPIPTSEEDKFDVVLMNPPFMGRDFIKHIRHAQAMLKADGALVSVIPFAWMATANKPVEIAFLDEATRTSSQLSTDYPAGTYDNTDCVTAIAEMVSKQAYEKQVANHKDYWLHVNCIEIENDSKFRNQFEKAKTTEEKRKLLAVALEQNRNNNKSPSVVEWLDDMLALVIDEDTANDELTASAVEPQMQTTESSSAGKQPVAQAQLNDKLEQVAGLLSQISKVFDAIEAPAEQPVTEPVEAPAVKPVLVTTKTINVGDFGFIVVAA